MDQFKEGFLGDQHDSDLRSRSVVRIHLFLPPAKVV